VDRRSKGFPLLKIENPLALVFAESWSVRVGTLPVPGVTDERVSCAGLGDAAAGTSSRRRLQWWR
jgi:hypothetical protein